MITGKPHRIEHQKVPRSVRVSCLHLDWFQNCYIQILKVPGETIKSHKTLDEPRVFYCMELILLSGDTKLGMGKGFS